MMKKVKSIFKSESYQYFELAMLAFGGLGIEMLYAFWLEPMIYGHSMAEFTLVETIIHWTLTIITWMVMAVIIIRTAKKDLGFQLDGNSRKWTGAGIAASCVLIGLVVFENFMDVGGLKIIHEFQKLGVLKFIFQHIYYLAEVVLFTLIIVFGQNALEKLFRKKQIPYGGILVGLTWGLAHCFSKGSIWTGLITMVLGFLFGAVYVFLDKDFKKTYIVLALAFII